MRQRTAASTTLIAGVLQSLLAVLCGAALLALPASASASAEGEPCPKTRAMRRHHRRIRLRARLTAGKRAVATELTTSGNG